MAEDDDSLDARAHDSAPVDEAPGESTVESAGESAGESAADTWGQRDLHWSQTRARRAYVAASAGRQDAARRALLLALVTFLLVASVATAMLAPRYFAAQHVAAVFCAALRGRDYPTAYALLDPAARGGLSADAYASALRTLDSAEGRVNDCGAAALAGYQYAPGQTTASDTLTLTRQRATLTGAVGLTFDGATWRITSVAQSLYGAPLASAVVAQSYCAALRAGDYPAAYALYSATLQGMQVESAYLTAQRLRDMLTGRVTGCSVIALSTPDAQTVNALLSVSRATGPLQGGDLQLQLDGGVWRISQLDPAIQGVDVGPYQVAQSFCADVASGDFGGVYDLLTDALQTRTTPAQLSSALIPGPGQRWSCGSAQRGSYVVTGDTATYRMTMTSSDPASAPAQRTETLQFALIAGAWRISGY